MAKHIQTQTEWESTMARRIMDQLRGELYLDQRYLNAALGALPPAPLPPGTTGAAFAADGARLCYPPAWVLATYRKNRRYLPRAYLHSVLHCIFRHLWLRGGRDRTLWGLACDIAVEQTIDALQVPSLTRPVGWLRQKTYQALRKNGAMPAAGPIYRWLAAQEPDELQKLNLCATATAFGPRTPPASRLRCRAAAGNSLGAKPASACSRQASRPGRLPGPKRCRHRSKQPTAAACTRTFCAALP